MPQDKSFPALALLEKAESIARTHRHNYLGVEHFFLASLQAGLLDQAAQSIGASRGAVIEAVQDLISPQDGETLSDALPRTPRMKRVLDRAAKKAVTQETQSPSDFPASLILESIFEEKTGLIPLAFESFGSKPEVFLAHFREPTGAGEKRDAKENQPPKKTATPLLDKMGRDLTDLARTDKLDPVIGRTEELRRVMQILTRKTKNVPVLVGEPGVGKTAVVFALAQRLTKKNVPAALLGKRLIEVPLASLVAGTSHRGEMEDRIQKLIRELSADPDCLVFIDEIHGLVGAGNTQGALDIANILKPALADGTIRIIGATTTEEYQKYLAQDQALERRLQPVLVKEPSEEDTAGILDGLKGRYEKHHGVTFDPESIEAAVKLSVRYLPDRRLPDKALDLLDEAASRVKTKTGTGFSLAVTEDDIAHVVSAWTGIPAEKLSSDEKNRLLNLEAQLKTRIVGQSEAIAKLSQAVRVSRAGLSNPKRPIGVFLFLGPTGVGKTELAKAAADLLYGSAEAMIRLDMSEYKEQHTVAKLIGAPPGYIGHDEEGQLTKAIRAKPYSLVLLDEIEKAHAEVFDLFLQIFDDGRLTDSKGRTVSFRNALMIMTSNLGSAQILADLENRENQAKRNEHIQTVLKGAFRPEFLNRIDEIIIFNPLGKAELETIVEMQLEELKGKIADQKLSLTVSPAVVEHLLEKGTDPAFGARPLRRTIETLLTKPLAEALLGAKFKAGETIAADLEDQHVIFRKGEPS